MLDSLPDQEPNRIGAVRRRPRWRHWNHERSVAAIVSYTLLLTCLPARGVESADFIWAKAVGGASDDLFVAPSEVALAPGGAIWATGIFIGTADFDPGPAIANLTSASPNSIFILKLDNSGNYLWAGAVGRGVGISGDVCALAVDSSGNVVVTGNFNGTADFDPGPGTANLTALSAANGFALKLDSSGNLIWAKLFGSGATGVLIPTCLHLDSSGNVFASGGLDGSADFDPGAGAANLSNCNYIVKWDPDGNFQWARAVGGSFAANFDLPFRLTLDSSENIYLCGRFSGVRDFDPGAGTVNLTSAGDWDAFVLKLDSTGNLTWARSVGGTDSDEANYVEPDSLGDVYVTGGYSTTADLDPGAGTLNLSSAGSKDVFILKLDASGSLVSAKSVGGPGYDFAYTVAVDPSDNIYVGGKFESTADFDPGAGAAQLTSAGADDIFVLKLDTVGNYLGVAGVGGSGSDYGGALVDSAGNLILAGNFQDTVDFDPGPGTANLTSAGSYDVYVAKLSFSNAVPALSWTGMWALFGACLVMGGSRAAWCMRRRALLRR